MASPMSTQLGHNLLQAAVSAPAFGAPVIVLQVLVLVVVLGVVVI